MAYNMFEDPTLMAAKNRLTPEEQEYYRKAGEHMYSFDYTGDGLQNLIDNAFEDIHCCLRSGQHPSTLSKDELNILNEKLGSTWYREYYYTQKDLTEIVTIPTSLPVPFTGSRLGRGVYNGAKNSSKRNHPSLENRPALMESTSSRLTESTSSALCESIGDGESKEPTVDGKVA